MIRTQELDTCDHAGYAVFMNNEHNSNTVHLQGIGKVAAKRADQFECFEVMMWNYGYTSTIKSITPKGKTMLTFVIVSQGKEYTRNMKRDRLVAVGPSSARET